MGAMKKAMQKAGYISDDAYLAAIEIQVSAECGLDYRRWREMLWNRICDDAKALRAAFAEDKERMLGRRLEAQRDRNAGGGAKKMTPDQGQGMLAPSAGARNDGSGAVATLPEEGRSRTAPSAVATNDGGEADLTVPEEGHRFSASSAVIPKAERPGGGQGLIARESPLGSAPAKSAVAQGRRAITPAGARLAGQQIAALSYYDRIKPYGKALGDYTRAGLENIRDAVSTHFDYIGLLLHEMPRDPRAILREHISPQRDRELWARAGGRPNDRPLIEGARP